VVITDISWSVYNLLSTDARYLVIILGEQSNMVVPSALADILVYYVCFSSTDVNTRTS